MMHFYKKPSILSKITSGALVVSMVLSILNPWGNLASALDAPSFTATQTVANVAAGTDDQTNTPATTTPNRASSEAGLEALTGISGYVVSAGGTGEVIITHTGTVIAGNPTFEESLNGDTTYDDDIAEIANAVTATGVLGVQASGETAGADGSVVTHVATGTWNNGKDIDITDDNLTDCATLTSGGINFYAASVSIACDLDASATGTILTASGLTDLIQGSPNMTAVVKGTGGNPVAAHTITLAGGVAEVQSVNTITISGNISALAKVKFNGTLVIIFFDTANSDTDGSDNNAILSRFQNPTAQVATITPANVEAGDTFTGSVNGTVVSYTASTGSVVDVTAGLTAAINASVQSGAVTAVDQTTHVEITSDTAGTAFTIDAGATNRAAVAQQVTFTPAIPTVWVTFSGSINGAPYNYTVAATKTVAEIVTAFQPLVDADGAVACTDDITHVTCTASSPGTPFTFAAEVVDITGPVISSTGSIIPNPTGATLTGITLTEPYLSGATVSFSGITNSQTWTILLTGSPTLLTGSISGLDGTSTFSATLTATDLSGNSTTESLGVFTTLFDYPGLYNTIGSNLTASGIANSLTGVTSENVTDFTGLYFEKAGYGKILFGSGMDLTNSGTIAFLQSLPSKLSFTGGVIDFNAAGSVFSSYGAQLFMYFTGASVPSFSGSTLDYITARDGSGNVVADALSGSTLLCAISVETGYQECTFASNHFTSFDFNPYLTFAHIESDNSSSGALARAGDVLTLSLSGSEAMTGVTVSFDGIPAASVLGSGDSWVATSQPIGTGAVAGAATFTVDFFDLNGNSGTTATSTTDSSSVTVSTAVPTASVMYSDTGATNQDVVATLTGASEPITITNNSGSGVYTFSANGTFTFLFVNDVGNTGSVAATVSNIDKTAPVISNKSTSWLTQTGVTVRFDFSESNFASGTGFVLAYTGWVVSQVAETGATTLSFTGGSGSGTSVFSGLTDGIDYGFLISLTDSVGNVATSTGAFSTPTIITSSLTGGTVTATGATALTGTTIASGDTLDLSGTTLTIGSNPADTNFITGSLTLSGTDILVSSGSWNGILLPPTLVSSSSAAAATGSEIGSGITVIQTIQVGAENASLSSTGGGYFNVSFVVPGYASGTVFDLYRSNDGTTWTLSTPDSTCTLDANLNCSFRTDHLTSFAPVIDSTPDAFSFTPVTGAELSTDSTATVTVAGINTGSAISISGGQYKIGAGSYTGSAGTVNSGDVVTIKLTSSSSYSTAGSLTLTIGGVSASFSVTTKDAPATSSSSGGGGGSALPSNNSTGSSYSFMNPSSSSSWTTGTTTPTPVTTTAQSKNPSFSDIADSFAKDFIERLVGIGAVSLTNDKYNPNRPATRAEFLKIALIGLSIPAGTGTTSSFTDVKEAWIIPLAEQALDLGIISGQTENGVRVFRPNAPITRAEALKIVLNAAKVSTSATAASTFSDVHQTWMIPFANRAFELNVISGQTKNGKLIFRPNDPITRAEVAKIVVNVMDIPVSNR